MHGAGVNLLRRVRTLPDETSPPAVVAETARLTIRHMAMSDAIFLLRQLNQPTWLQYIGDKGVRSLGDAERYVAATQENYRKLGFGMYIVQLKGGDQAGVCGLVKRDTLPHPDLGFALLEAQFGKGYALEAAAAVVQYGRDALGIRKLLAITTPSNERSAKLLLKLGFRRTGTVRMPSASEELNLYTCDL
jgi:RimJ/RimL family protein N-acetyltransferase